MLKLLRSETGENVWNNTIEETENETRKFYTPTKIVRINSTQNNDPDISRHIVTGVLTDPQTNQEQKRGLKANRRQKNAQ